MRAAHAAAYSSDAALTAGFDLYRAFAQDARDNTAFAKTAAVDTPVLYLRGDGEGGDIATYAQGFRDAGIQNLTTAVLKPTPATSPRKKYPSGTRWAPLTARQRVWADSTSLKTMASPAAGTVGHLRPQGHGREGRLDRIRRPQMYPMVGREVEERQHLGGW